MLREDDVETKPPARMSLWESQVLRFTLIISAALAVVLVLVPFEIHIVFVHVTRALVAIFVIVAYVPALYTIIYRNPMDRVSQLVLGILCSWAATAMLGMWSVFWRVNNEWGWMKESTFLSALLVLQTLGGMLHITAPGAIDGKVQARNWTLLVSAVGLSLFASGVIIGWAFVPRIVGTFYP